MSSEVEAVGLIAAAVTMPAAAAAFGAGWLAWQGGKLLVEAGRAANREVEEQKRLLAEKEKQWKETENAPAFHVNIPEAAEPGYKQYEITGLMEEIKSAFAAASVSEMSGSDITSADPVALERAKLNDRLTGLIHKMVISLEHVEYLTEEYGLSEAASKWLHSCFNGVDTAIASLTQPTTDNEELKRGIKRLEGMMEQYEMMIPSIDRTCINMQALYEVYVAASRALGEKIEKKRTFQNEAALEARLQELKERSKRAEACGEIYRKLGKNAYICYAWDQELRALGYSVHSRKEIMEKANVRPQHAQVGDAKMPFYKWSESEMTQLYSVSEKCDLQVIVHEDGTVSMKAIANSDKTKAAEETQNSHCNKLQRLHENLKKNWFLIYDYEETERAENVMSFAEWSESADNAWNDLPQARPGEKRIGERAREGAAGKNTGAHKEENL